MAHNPLDLFSLIDAYAKARADREAATDAASWALADAERVMVTARAKIAAALGIDADRLPVLADATSTLAASARARDDRWRAMIERVAEGTATPAEALAGDEYDDERRRGILSDVTR